MNRIENIILTLATAAALIAASIAKANPNPCPETGAKSNRPMHRSGEAPEDGQAAGDLLRLYHGE